ncbi:NAD(+) synthase [Patescibacteria group bacterium]
MNYGLTKEQCSTVAQNASQLLYEYCRQYNIHHVVVGISGGLDSAVTLALASNAQKIATAYAYKLEPVAIMMPCQSSGKSISLARAVIDKLDVYHMLIDLTETFAFMQEKQLDPINKQIFEQLTKVGPEVKQDDFEYAQKIAQGNVKARLRMITVYHVARMLNGLVLSTDNLSELWMGFWTICGDVGDYGMIQNVLKGTELYDLARYLGVPKEIIDAKPDDGLGVAGGDADQLGATYPVIDEIMLRQIHNGLNPDGGLGQLKSLITIPGVDFDTVTSITKRALQNAFKRRGTLNLSREQLGLPPLEQIKL